MPGSRKRNKSFLYWLNIELNLPKPQTISKQIVFSKIQSATARSGQPNTVAVDSVLKAQECYCKGFLESRLEKTNEEGQQMRGPWQWWQKHCHWEVHRFSWPSASRGKICCCADQGSSAGCTELTTQSLPVPLPVLDGMTHCCGS